MMRFLRLSSVALACIAAILVCGGWSRPGYERSGLWGSDGHNS
jgi:hypothetical protein